MAFVSEQIVDDPHHRWKEFRSAATGRWITERRDVLADYRRAFGAEPGDGIRAVALFTDNDQTKEPIEAYYGRGHMACKEP
ncbi:MAG: DUF3047 domain-containing protein [Rhodospirillales bacterium]|nr:DUF3047 domain-containing protein [Rhodospirillales bacterium]